MGRVGHHPALHRHARLGGPSRLRIGARESWSSVEWQESVCVTAQPGRGATALLAPRHAVALDAVCPASALGVVSSCG